MEDEDGQLWQKPADNRFDRCLANDRLTFVLYLNVTYLFLSRLQLVKARHRFGSGHRSNGLCPFLFLYVKSAPLAARNIDIDALLFLSAPWLPSPINNWKQSTWKIIFIDVRSNVSLLVWLRCWGVCYRWLMVVHWQVHVYMCYYRWNCTIYPHNAIYSKVWGPL